MASHIETFFHVKKKKKSTYKPSLLIIHSNHGWNHDADRKIGYLGALKTLMNTKWFQY